MRRIVFLIGPPGCGKGTQAKFLEGEGFLVASMSDLLRKENKEIKGSALSPCHVVNEVLIGHLEPRTNEDVVIDGFPRTEKQARFAVEHFQKTGSRLFFIILDLSEETSWRHVSGRMEGREDDREDLFRERFGIYQNEITGLQMYLYNHAPDLVNVINGEMTKENIATEIQHITYIAPVVELKQPVKGAGQ